MTFFSRSSQSPRNPHDVLVVVNRDRGPWSWNVVVAVNRDRGRSASTWGNPIEITSGHKRQRFAEASGECGEVAAVIELVDRLALIPGEDHIAELQLAGRVAAMLAGLVRKFS